MTSKKMPYKHELVKKQVLKCTADGRSRHMPPYRTQIFCFHIHYHQKAPAPQVHAPPTGNPGSATGCTISGGSTYKSFRRPPPPPTGPNSFVFTYVFTKKHLCRRLAPPPTRVGAPPPPQREILDPPLTIVSFNKTLKLY